MFDLGWSELLIIGVAALIVVGPKDLPRMLRTLGQYAAKAKNIAREFQRSMDDAARQADLDDLRQVKKDLDTDVSGIREAQYKMQREMSQSFMDKPGDKPGDKAGGKGKEKPAAAGDGATGGDDGKGGSGGSGAEQGAAAPAGTATPAAEPSAEPPAKPPAKPRAKPAAKPPAQAEPGPPPRKASGA